jgi:hypothetical protein
MTVHKCSTCFYHAMATDEAPCIGCSGYSNWLHEDTFKEPVPLTKPDFAPLSQSINNWFKEQNAGYKIVDDDYDVVDKPKHYMLFEDEGIEVRHVIEKLVNKIPPTTHTYSGLFVADYVQHMQYMMRFMDKNGVEDLKKARWYLDKMIEVYEPHV